MSVDEKSERSGKRSFIYVVLSGALNCTGSLNLIDRENVEVNGIIKIFITVMCFLSASHSPEQPFCERVIHERKKSFTMFFFRGFRQGYAQVSLIEAYEINKAKILQIFGKIVLKMNLFGKLKRYFNVFNISFVHRGVCFDSVVCYSFIPSCLCLF